MNSSCTYQISVKFEDNVIFMTYLDAPRGHEEILKDFMFQQFQDQQPDITKYSVIDMKANPDAFIEALLGKTPKKVTPQSCLANLASEYSNKYQ